MSLDSIFIASYHTKLQLNSFCPSRKSETRDFHKPCTVFHQNSFQMTTLAFCNFSLSFVSSFAAEIFSPAAVFCFLFLQVTKRLLPPGHLLVYNNSFLAVALQKTCVLQSNFLKITLLTYYHIIRFADLMHAPLTLFILTQSLCLG